MASDRQHQHYIDGVVYVRRVGTLAFFPWLRLAPGSSTVGEFELIPYTRASYAGPHAAAIDAITRPYREANNGAIREATLLRLMDCDLIADLDDDQINAAFKFSEMVALVGLARRCFFDPGRYSNRDNYRLVIQRFDEPGKGSSQRTRRRDGTRNVYVMAAVHVVPGPSHVDLERVELDVDLLRALVTCSGDANADRFIESMMTFNLANTDSSAMSPHVELVLWRAPSNA